MIGKDKIEDSWKEVLFEEFEKPYFNKLAKFVEGEYLKNRVYPHPENIFRAFSLCPFNDVKVVIIGQDPYHGERQANGLCFSVSENISIPPSLRNIYKEIGLKQFYIENRSPEKIKKQIFLNGDLSRWAKQGVLLLNSILTVRAGEPGSHQKKGWEEFTDVVVRKLSDEKEHIVFILWGNYAKKKGEIIDRKKHLVLESSHPSPFSAHKGFFGCKHFSKTNTYLKKWGKGEIGFN
jgi:uracil-DNA glycosylase